MPIYEFVCKACGNTTIKRRAQGVDIPQFCSKECHYNYGRSKITCPICKTEKVIKKSHIDRVFSCGKKECTHALKWQRFKTRLEQKIGEPIIPLIKRLYIDEKLSYRDITNQTQINGRIIAKLLKDCGVKPRERSAAIKNQWESGKHNTQLGENNYMWRGGISYYNNLPANEWRQIAQTVRQRDGDKCTRCGLNNYMSIEIFGSALDVHHIIPYVLSKDNSLSNLRALCKRCHRIVEAQFFWLL